MTRDETLRVLREHREHLTRQDVKSLALFGSSVRDEAGPHSDVDVLVEFEGPATFDRYLDVKWFLESLLRRPVDLVTRKALKPRLRLIVEKEAVYVT